MGLGFKEFCNDFGIFGFGTDLVSAGDFYKLKSRRMVVFASDFFKGVFDFIDGTVYSLREFFGSCR